MAFTREPVYELHKHNYHRACLTKSRGPISPISRPRLYDARNVTLGVTLPITRACFPGLVPDLPVEAGCRGWPASNLWGVEAVEISVPTTRDVGAVAAVIDGQKQAESKERVK